MELDSLTKSLKDQDPDDIKIEWGKFKEYLGKHWKMKGLLTNQHSPLHHPCFPPGIQ